MRLGLRGCGHDSASQGRGWREDPVVTDQVDAGGHHQAGQAQDEGLGREPDSRHAVSPRLLEVDSDLAVFPAQASQRQGGPRHVAHEPFSPFGIAAVCGDASVDGEPVVLGEPPSLSGRWAVAWATGGRSHAHFAQSPERIEQVLAQVRIVSELEMPALHRASHAPCQFLDYALQVGLGGDRGADEVHLGW